MYDAVEDPYCYPGTTVLRNRLDIRDPQLLQAFEEEMVRTRAEEPLPGGSLTVRHYRATHRHLFQDVYPWAGRIRTVRIFKAGSPFCYPEHIVPQLRRLFAWLQQNDALRGRGASAFAEGAAYFLAELNAIHAFRDGNGRAQLALIAEIAARAGHPFDFSRLEPRAFLDAMVASFRGGQEPLEMILGDLIRS